MADIHPIPKDEPKRISPFKAIVFGIIIVGVLLFGLLQQIKYPQSNANQVNLTQVLGENTQTLNTYIPDDIRQGKLNPESILATGQELASSAAGSFIQQAGQEADKVASETAKSVTDFVYKNSIERIIDSLIQSLPLDRQQRYNR